MKKSINKNINEKMSAPKKEQDIVTNAEITVKESEIAVDAADAAGTDFVADNAGAIDAVIPKKKKFATFRAALVCLIIFTVVLGIIYPLSVTLVAQAAFPYEANGSVITVTLEDGTQQIFGSELIGQEFNKPTYLLGRVNLGAPTNLSPESAEFKENVKKRKEFLISIGHSPESIPAELVTSSGSGVDPHISPAAAKYQVTRLTNARNEGKSGDDLITEAQVRAVIKKYTEGRFLWIFGEKRVNVLLVNLALDGRI